MTRWWLCASSAVDTDHGHASSDPDDALESACGEAAVEAMRTHLVAHEARQLLRRLAAGDELCLQTVLWPGAASGPPLLDTRTRLLVRLAALLALDASTDSLRWAVDLASAAGADDEALAAVLIVSGQTAGSAQLATSASRLASALGIEAGDDDGAAKLRLLPEQPRVRGTRDRL